MKKIITFILALVASVGISSAAITVRLDSCSCSSWKTVRLWAWTDEGNVFDSWPGQIVSSDGDGWYAYTFSSSITSVSIIWTNGTDQTVDITGVTSSTCYKLNSQTGTTIKVSVVDCSSDGGQSEPIVVSGRYKIGELYYNLNEDKTAEVTYELGWDENNYKGLTTANIPASVTYNGTTYSVTSIGGNAFRYCSSLTSVTIPNSVTSIGRSAFEGCSSLTSVTLNSNTIVGKDYYEYNSNIKSIFGEQVTEYILGDEITSIGSRAFYNCSSLTSVTIPNSVTRIGWYAFSGCSSLPVVDNLRYADTYLVEAVDRTRSTYTIKDGTRWIGEDAFSGCSSLTSVTIPNSVTSIGIHAFVGCTSLRIIKLESPVPAGWNDVDVTPWGGVFPDYENLLFYVPCGSIDAYIHAWGREYHGEYWGTGDWYNDQLVREHFLNYPLEYSVMCSPNDPNFGETEYPLTICDDTILTATPKFQCHFVRWSDGNTDNPRRFELTKDTTFEAIFAHNPVITYTYDSNLGYIDGPTTTPTGMAEDDITFTAQPARGCIFVKWGDGNTDNPRTYHLSQDVTMEAIFDYALSGNCGKDNVLTWKLDKSAMALEISGAGALADNFNYTYDIVSATIGNEVTLIGQNAFAYCSKLKNVIVGSNVKVIEEYAFDDCTAIETITCYSMRPPTVNNGAFENLDYSTIVYVPADYLNTYKMHDFWGVYDVRPIGTSKTETTEVKVEPTATTADVAWPAVENAATYELVIKDKNGNVVCTLIFNANGQLTQIDFGAPTRDNTAQAAGFAFTVTGLEEGTSYDLTITAKDNNGTTLDEKTIAFTTSGWTGADALQAGELHSSKELRNGEVLILRGGKMYNLQGVEVK